MLIVLIKACFNDCLGRQASSPRLFFVEVTALVASVSQHCDCPPPGANNYVRATLRWKVPSLIFRVGVKYDRLKPKRATVEPAAIVERRI